MARRTLKPQLCLLLFACSPFMCCWGCLTVLNHPRERLARLLSGDEGVAVTKMMSGIVVVDDPDSLAYLNNALRSAVAEGHVPEHHDGTDYTGPTMYVKIWTDGYGVISVSLTLTNDVKVSGITVGFLRDELDPDECFYWVPLPKPIPPPLARLFDEARKQERNRGQKLKLGSK